MPVIVALAAALAVPAAADRASAGLADLAAIDSAVAGFTGAPPGVPGGAAARVDRRLRLRSCAADLALAWRTARRDTVVVRCPEADGWTLYVPVSGGGGGAAEAPIINRGDAVSISIAGDGFSVAESGEALESGAEGAWIKVLPAGDRRAAPADALRARVVRPGLVALTIP